MNRVLDLWGIGFWTCGESSIGLVGNWVLDLWWIECGTRGELDFGPVVD